MTLSIHTHLTTRHTHTPHHKKDTPGKTALRSFAAGPWGMPYCTSSCSLSVKSAWPQISCFSRTAACFAPMQVVAHPATWLDVMVETPVSHLLVIVRATLVTAPDLVRIIQNMACRQPASAAG